MHCTHSYIHVCITTIILYALYTQFRALLKCRQPEISPATKPFSPVISGYSRPELTQSIARSLPTITGAPPTNFLMESPAVTKIRDIFNVVVNKIGVKEDV